MCTRKGWMSLLALQTLSEILCFSHPKVKPAMIFGSTQLHSFGTYMYLHTLASRLAVFLGNFFTVKLFHCHMTKDDALAPLWQCTLFWSAQWMFTVIWK